MNTHFTRVPPGPRGYPIIGDLLPYIQDPLGYGLRLASRYGGIVRVPIPGVENYGVTDPKLVEQVLVTDHKSYGKGILLKRLGEDVLGDGLLSSDGELWRRQRRLAQPAFYRERIAAYAEITTAVSDEYLATLRSGQRRNLHQDMVSLSLQIIGRSLFSTELGDVSAEIGQILGVIMDRYSRWPFLALPLLTKLPLAMNRRFDRACARLKDLVLGLVCQRRARGASPKDLLSLLLDAQDENGGAMSDKQLRDELITMFAAGHETTALLLTYTFWLLSQHCDARTTLNAELDAVLGQRTPSIADLPALRYTQAVILESLRCYPPAWMVGRRALRDTELGGYAVPRGTQILIHFWAMHRNPQFFPRPESFFPERWLGGLQKTLPRFAYLPFGGGQRTCIGNNFVMTAAMLILATVARRFSLHIEEPAPLRLLPAPSLRFRQSLFVRVDPKAAA
jgi:cytochrome P450